MTAFRISEAAALSILEQADYFRESADATLSQRWEASVEDSILSLLAFPERGAHCRFYSPVLADLRWIPVVGFAKHLIFYRYTSADQLVLIVQVAHGARDLETVLAPDS